MLHSGGLVLPVRFCAAPARQSPSAQLSTVHQFYYKDSAAVAELPRNFFVTHSHTTTWLRIGSFTGFLRGSDVSFADHANGTLKMD